MDHTGKLKLADYAPGPGLLGQAALALWGNVTGDEDLFNTWYTHEHLPERVRIPGFLRARRFTACSELAQTARWKYFTLYEVHSAATLSSPDYLALLNGPTPATLACLPQFTDLRRTACRVSFTRALGQGGHAIVLEFGPEPAHETALRDWITGPLARRLLRRSGSLAVHLLEVDEKGTAVARAVNVYGNVPTASGRWLLIFEGAWTDLEAASQFFKSEIADIAVKGAAGDSTSQVFRLLAEMSPPR